MAQFIWLKILLDRFGRFINLLVEVVKISIEYFIGKVWQIV
jgi:hypothetical protein